MTIEESPKRAIASFGLDRVVYCENALMVLEGWALDPPGQTLDLVLKSADDSILEPLNHNYIRFPRNDLAMHYRQPRSVCATAGFISVVPVREAQNINQDLAVYRSGARNAQRVAKSAIKHVPLGRQLLSTADRAVTGELPKGILDIFRKALMRSSNHDPVEIVTTVRIGANLVDKPAIVLTPLWISTDLQMALSQFAFVGGDAQIVIVGPSSQGDFQKAKLILKALAGRLRLGITLVRVNQECGPAAAAKLVAQHTEAEWLISLAHDDLALSRNQLDALLKRSGTADLLIETLTPGMIESQAVVAKVDILREFKFSRLTAEHNFLGMALS